MAELNVHAGLNISNTKLQLVEIFGSHEEVRLDNLNEIVFAEPINFKSDRDVKILSLLQVALDEIRIKKHIKSRTLSFSLPLEMFHITQLPYDNTLLHRDIGEEFKWEYSVMFPHIKDEEIVIQYYEVDKNMIYTKNTALVYGIERKYLRLFNKLCEQNNFNLGHVDNVHLSSERALVLSNSCINNGFSLSIYISKSNLSIILSLDGKPISQKVYPYNNIDDILSIVQNEISSFESKNLTKELIQAAYITGERISESFVKSLNAGTGLDFIAFNPFDKLTATLKIKESPLYLQRFNTFSPAAGIAYRIV